MPAWRGGSTGLAVPAPALNSWHAAFTALTDCLTRTPLDTQCVLFFDELPWLATPRSGMLQALDYFWNTRWSLDRRIKIILCGSAASWMLDKLVHAKGGLHNRLTHSLLLQPFQLHQTQQYLEARNIHWPQALILEIYLALGGVPYYLSLLEPGFSPAENIQRLCFAPQGLLTDEFVRVFHALYDDAEAHVKLVRTMASRRGGVSLRELTAATGLKSGGSLNRPLEELRAAGFVERFTPCTGPIFRRCLGPA